MDTYNSLHVIATSLRISVSLLISQLLDDLQADATSAAGFLNYAFMVTNWSSESMQVVETLFYSGTPPPLTP